jgi:hypothetical protein
MKKATQLDGNSIYDRNSNSPQFHQRCTLHSLVQAFLKSDLAQHLVFCRCNKKPLPTSRVEANGGKTGTARDALPADPGARAGCEFPRRGNPTRLAIYHTRGYFSQSEKTTILLKPVISLLTTLVSYVSNKGKQRKEVSSEWQHSM